MVTWHPPRFKDSYSRVECSRSISLKKKFTRTTNEPSGLRCLWLGMDYMSVFSFIWTVCWTTTWQSLNHFFHRFQVDQSISQSAVSQRTNQSNWQSVDIVKKTKLNIPLCFATGAPVNVSVTVFVEFIGDIDEINMVCLLCCYVEVSQSDFIPRYHEIYQHKSAQTIRYHISKVQNVLLVQFRVIYISTCKFFKTLEKCKLPGVGALLTNPLGHPLVFWQPLSQVLSPSVGTSKRESWERGWCFESDGVLVFKLTIHSERFFFLIEIS